MVDILVNNWIEDWSCEHTDPADDVDSWEDQFVLVYSLEISDVHNLFWIMIMKNKNLNFNLKPYPNSLLKAGETSSSMPELSIYCG